MSATHDKLVSFLISQAIIWVPLLTGHQLRLRGLVGEGAAKPIYALSLSCITPLAYTLGAWRLDRSTPGWQWVPVAMAILLTLLTVVASWASFRFIARRRTAGTFAILLPLSNTGYTMAGFLTLLLLSDAGYAFNSLLMVPMVVFISMVWFPQAKHLGHGGRQSFWRSYRQAMLNGQSLQIVGLAAGAGLNYAGVPMAQGWVTMLRAIVFGGTVLIMFAMGLRLRLGRLGGYQSLLRWAYLAKFLVGPLIMIGLCLAFGVHGTAAGALLIAAAAPAGVNVVIYSTLFDLDVDLANAGYLWTTFIFMVVVLPAIILLLQTPMFQ